MNEARPVRSMEDIIRDKLMLSDFYKKNKTRFDSIVNRMRDEDPSSPVSTMNRWIKDKTVGQPEGLQKVFDSLMVTAKNKGIDLGEFIEAYEAAKKPRKMRRVEKPEQPKKGFNISDLFR